MVRAFDAEDRKTMLNTGMVIAPSFASADSKRQSAVNAMGEANDHGRLSNYLPWPMKRQSLISRWEILRHAAVRANTSAGVSVYRMQLIS